VSGLGSEREEDVLSPFVLSKKLKSLTFYIHLGPFKIPIIKVTPMYDFFFRGSSTCSKEKNVFCRKFFVQ
jgi:hypothetical protein